MSVRSLGYDSDNLDKIFYYFMRVILHLQKTGVEDLPLENNLPSPYKPFLDTAMDIFLRAPLPELCCGFCTCSQRYFDREKGDDLSPEQWHQAEPQESVKAL